MPRQEALPGFRTVWRNGFKFVRQYVIYTHVTSKAGVIGLTLSMEDESEARTGQSQQRLQARAIKRAEVPQDLVGTVVFLCSSDSDFITGQTLVVDGGAQMH
jgi:NAD(P)-dependent dehydrogenase (short-subunit alcohol dehydrogenase family)